MTVGFPSVGLLFLGALCSTRSAVDIKYETFIRALPIYTSTPIGPSWKETTLLACIRKCVSSYTPCQSATYNAITQECVRGSKLTLQPPSFTQQTDNTELYYNIFCDRDLELQVYLYRSLILCLFFSTKPETFSSARQKCRDKNSRLYVVTTDDKLELLRYVSRNVNNGSTWIGLSDIDKEGTFVWEDGQEFNTSSYPKNWRSGQPDNKGINEHCVEMGSSNDFQNYNDYSCGSRLHFMCELVPY